MNKLVLLFSLVALAACSAPPENDQEVETAYGNPAAPGFNQQASDSEAVRLADSVMEAMGGRAAWDDLQYVSWNFFGARDLLWDKENGRVRIDFPARKGVYIVDLEDMTGMAWEDSVQITNQDTLQDRLTMARNIWINDSYWLFMPFKLKDSGVTLKHSGRDTMMNGSPAEVLTLTFNEVGVTPENKYQVYVSPDDHLVYQWAYYQNASQDSASAIWPWDNYQRYGDLLLSADRSDKRGPRNVRVYESVPEEAFTQLEKPSLK